MAVKKLPALSSVLSPSAHNARLCEVVESEAVAELPWVRWVKPDSGLSLLDRLVIELLFGCGLRISEALGVRGCDVLQNRMIRVIGKKKSNDRLVQLSYCSSFVLGLRAYSIERINIASRFYYHRLFIKLGLYAEYQGCSHRVVTHLGRNLMLQSIVREGVDLETAKVYIGHKNIKNTLHYVSKKKQ